MLIDFLGIFKLLLWFSMYMGFVVLFVISLLLFLLRQRFHKARIRNRNKEKVPTIAFFHPYCNAGGGGERVLWCAIRSLQLKYKEPKIVVYTGDIEASPDEIINKVKQRFNIEIPGKVEFEYLHRREWVEACKWPYCTMFGQSLGSMWLAIEALEAVTPDLCIDSMGYAFALALFKLLGGCKTACYVHYPTITHDMLHLVAHNRRNRGSIKRYFKLYYYKLFARCYKLAGKSAEIVMVNSSWTQDRLDKVWQRPLATHRVYPPCEVNQLLNIPRTDQLKQFRILSVAQFRPEKDHPLQLRALYELRELLKGEGEWNNVRLVFAGSCRHQEDIDRVNDLKSFAKHLALDEYVEFKTNLSHDELMDEFSKASAAIHAMWNEHFGIGVVECLAAGLLTVAHNSGGPMMDIIEQTEGSRTGWLAADEVEYSKILFVLLKLPLSARISVIEAARSSVSRFSTEEFNKSFLSVMSSMIENL